MTLAHSIQSACKTYGIGRTSLYALLNNGTLRAKKFNKKTLIDGASLQAWYEGLPEGTRRGTGPKAQQHQASVSSAAIGA